MGNDEAKLFVAGLPDSISEEVLKQIFEATGGSVINVSLPKDRATGRPRGFGFVTLSTPAEAQSARDALDGSMQGGKSISVRPFQAEPPRRDGVGAGPGPRTGGFGASRSAGPGGAGGGGGAAPPDRTLYVGNLPYDCTQQEVEILINGVADGQVVRVHLPTDPDGRKRGFGFVTMASAETAKSASEALRTADIRGRKLVVNLAHPKGERPARSDSGGFGGGYGGGGGGGFAAGGGGASPGGGFPPAGFGGPAPPRRTFDERRRKPGGGGGDDGSAKKPRKDRGRDDDWRNKDSDDD
jgi:RNA recognition motif-containing protein